MKIIDGSRGEGGGQILRSSLTLASILGEPLRVVKIRSGRKKPGLLRQHLTCVQALAEVCGAETRGAELGSDELEFLPGPLRAGVYSSSVGTAGSTSLVLQTLLPALLFAPGVSELTVSGGTHNPMAPPFEFLEQVYLPVLRELGVDVDIELHAHGFYPAGGGRVALRLRGGAPLRSLESSRRPDAMKITAWALGSRVEDHVLERELEIVRAQLGLTDADTRLVRARSAGPGNAICVRLGERELVTAFGERGRRAEAVAEEVVSSARAYLEHTHAVGEHLADQLVLLVSLTGGSFTTAPLSLHASTNVDVVRQFLGPGALEVEELADGVCVRAPGWSGRAR